MTGIVALVSDATVDEAGNDCMLYGIPISYRQVTDGLCGLGFPLTRFTTTSGGKMARIGAEELERLKREVDLSGLVRGQGVELTPRGDDLVGRCPFGTHDDTTPSFHVTPSKGLFHCFGCGAAGSVVDWVMKTRSVSFRNAIEILRAHGGTAPVAPLKTNKRLVSEFPTDVDDQGALQLVANHYHQRLKQDAAAQAYLTARGIGAADIVEKFKVGFVDRTLGYHLQPAVLKAGGEMRARLQRLGVLRESGHELLRGCVTFPLMDEAGQIVGMYGRRTQRPPREGTPVHWYLPGPRRGVFNLVDGIRGQETVVLCESIIDTLTFYANGIRNVTCAYGVEGFSDDSLEALKGNGVKRVQIAFDRDDAGDRGAEKVAAKLMALGIECLRVKFPLGMDANDYVKKVALPDMAFKVLLNAAEWMGAGVRSVSTETSAAETEQPADQVVEAVEDAMISPLEEEHPPTETQPPSTKPPLSLTHVESATCQPAADDLDAEEHHFSFGPRKYRVRGLKVNTSLMVMKVNITVRSGTAFYVDTLDLLIARARAHFIKMTSVELGVDEGTVKADVGSLLERLEAIQDARLQKLLEKPSNKAPPMTEDDKAAAMRLLKDPRLLDRVVDDIEKLGLVGERTNKLLCYVAAVSRKLHKPLAIIIQSRSGGGKSSLMEAVLALIPDEEVVKYSAMTSQALYYMGETNLCHKILALAEEEGAEKAAYALKLLQSEGELTIASTGKNPQSGRHETKEYHVEGPVMVFVTTTASEIDEEFLNRCLVLTVDESREQTRAIHTAQKNALTREGILRRNEKSFVLNVHRNAQRLLKPLAVENPFGNRLTFPDHEMRTRRDFPKYTSLIEAITLLHQHQREIKEIVTEHGEVVETVVTTVEDIIMANELVTQVLGQSLDELQAQTRRLLQLIQAMVADACKAEGVAREDFRFTQRRVREYTGWGNTQLKMHLARLVDRELIVLHRGGPGLRHFYELCYDEKVLTDGPVMCGLINAEALNTIVTGRGLAGGSRGDVAGLSATRATGANGHETRRNGFSNEI